MAIEAEFSLPYPLSFEWVPPKLLAREEYCEEIINATKMGESIYISGDSGTGKTTTVRFLQTKLSDTIYIKLGHNIKSYLLEALDIKQERAPHFSWNTLCRILTDQYRIIILDDAQNVKPSVLATFLHTLYESKKSRKNISFILISINPLTYFQKIMPHQVLRRYMFIPITFSKYSYQQIYDILKQRVELVWTSYEEEALSFVAAKSTKWGNDPTLGIKILARAYLLSTDKNMLCEDLVLEAWKIEKMKYWTKELLRFGGHGGLLLKCIAQEVLEINDDTVLTSSIYNRYREECKKLKIEPYYPQKLNYLLKKLEAVKYIELMDYSMPREGQKIRFLFDDPAIIVETANMVNWYDYCL